MYQMFKNKSQFGQVQECQKRWNECIALEGDYVDEWSRILPKSCCFISRSTNLLSDVLWIGWLMGRLEVDIFFYLREKWMKK